MQQRTATQCLSIFPNDPILRVYPSCYRLCQCLSARRLCLPKCLSNSQSLWCPEPHSCEYLHYKHNGIHNEWFWTIQHSRLHCHRAEYIYRIRRISYGNKQIRRSCTDARSRPRLWTYVWSCHSACWGLWWFHAPLVNTFDA